MAVVGVEGGVLVGYNRLCGVISGVDLEMCFVRMGSTVFPLCLVVVPALARILLCSSQAGHAD